MKTISLILIFLPLFCFSQSFEEINASSSYDINSKFIKDKISNEYLIYFAELLKNRDTTFLKIHIDTTQSDVIYLIEGFNFATNEYSIFESYQYNNYCLEFLDGNNISTEDFCHFNFHNKFIPRKTIDKISPRCYRYGVGNNKIDKTQNIISDLKLKAKKDGLIIETYCKLETLIYRKQNIILITYLTPIKGTRKFINYGTMKNWLPSLDFWLFPTPKYLK